VRAVGLPDVNIVGVVDDTGGPLWVHIETRGLRPCCPGCKGAAHAKDRPIVELVDLPAFGRPTRLMWRKRRWACPTSSCPTGTWTEEVGGIAAPRLALTDRAGRWATEQVGRNVNDVAVELGCDWYTVNHTVIAYGTALVDDDPYRIGQPIALGLDETLFCRVWPRRQHWSTSIVDVGAGRLLDVVPGRTTVEPCRWLAARSEECRANIRWATLDLSGPYRSVFNTMLPDAVQIADPLRGIPRNGSYVEPRIMASSGIGPWRRGRRGSGRVA